ncbi:MAG: nitroreductase family protein [Chloroflexi bacterium]|nr:nitroreductase family protein [Chloroflexota bacterium]MCH8284202.1 nitroreductase family protein [Chloroflexota bacterium]MCI0770150.1 nitroreductase family protein [Chloroflexota bacterium]
MEFFEVIHTQRSIRRFKPDPVPDDLIWKMIDAAIRAPSGSNLQPWVWLVVRDQAKREAVARAVRERLEAEGRLQEMRRNAEQLETASRRLSVRRAVELFENLAAAPVLIIPCLIGVTSPVSEARSLFAGSSIYGAVQNLMLAARALGVGTVLTTPNIYVEEMLVKEFHLPENAIPACIIPVGFPDGQRFGPTTRKPAETVTYWDDWGAAADRRD